MAKGVRHYLKDGTKHTGGMHKMTDGDFYTGNKHADSSKKLYHYRDLPSPASKKRARKRCGCWGPSQPSETSSTVVMSYVKYFGY